MVNPDIDSVKTCASCIHSLRPAENPKYLICQLSELLCGEMRKGECGPDAKFWEAKDGEA